MPHCLALDCSTSRGSLALGWQAIDEPSITVLEWEFPAGRGEGGRLFDALTEAMEYVRHDGDPLRWIVVGLGPGSYSGVRQAIAAAVGLAAATGARLWGAPSPLALVTPGPLAAFQAVGDARRGAFYHTAVQDGACLAGPQLLESPAQLATSLALYPGLPAFAAGDALPADTLPDAPPVCLPLAAALFYVSPAARVAPPLEPIYLRPVSITLPRPKPAAAPP